MIIIVDSREQQPFSFAELSNVQTEAGSLAVGDYSLRGLEAEVAIERKSMADLVMCLGRERERFARELERGRALRSFAVVVEGTYADLAAGNYRGRLNANSAVASVASFMARLRVPFLFAGSRPLAERATASFLWTYAKGESYRMRAIERALRESMEGKR